MFADTVVPSVQPQVSPYQKLADLRIILDDVVFLHHLDDTEFLFEIVKFFHNVVIFWFVSLVSRSLPLTANQEGMGFLPSFLPFFLHFFLLDVPSHHLEERHGVPLACLYQQAVGSGSSDN